MQYPPLVSRIAIIIGLIGWFAQIGSAASLWTESSFDDFKDGSFEDGGANTYVSRAGRIQTVNRWDANGDGYIDLAFSNTHAISEGLNLSLYWGGPADYSIRNHSLIPVNGAQWVLPADVNGDGRLDLVVANYSNGSTTDMASSVYYGTGSRSAADNPAGWSFPPFSKHVDLPTSSAQNAAVGDLNRDGHLDIVFAQSGGHWEYRHSDKDLSSPSIIYWGSAEGFSPQRFTKLPAIGACDAAVTDLNADGWPEIVFANRGLAPNFDVDSFIYWGGEQGFDPSRRTGLPTHQTSAVKIFDANGDLHPDVLFANESGSESYLYLSQNGEFSPDNRIEFQTTMAKDCVAADFDRDGLTDVFFSQHQLSGNPFTDSIIYYNSATGFSPEHVTRLPTIGAWGANAADLNGDGLVDLLISNFREYYSYEVPSFIYWNTPHGFQPTLRTPLYEHGAVGNAIADFDGDGRPDVIINSTTGRSRADYDPNYIYWGNREGQYSTAARTDLPGREVYEFAMSDLDDDGRVDLLLANSGEVSRKLNETWIYWNTDAGYSPAHVTGLTTSFGTGVEIADLDRDGYLDVVLCGRSFQEQPLTSSFIYWGSAAGFSTLERTPLNAGGGACSIADFDGDGHLDLLYGAGGNLKSAEQLASIFWGDGGRTFSDARRSYLPDSEKTDQAAVADFNRDGALDIAFSVPAFSKDYPIYYGSGDRKFRAASTRLPSQGLNVSINAVDLNRDGWLDLITPIYLAAGPPITRDTLTPIWWGGPQGFSADNKLMIPTNSGTGSLVSDFDHNGLLDLFIYCHRKEGSIDRVNDLGDHVTDSFLYWGRHDGFSPQHRLLIPGAGPHYDSGADIGTIQDRSFKFAYDSSPYEATERPRRIRWEAQTPGDTQMLFQLRSAATEADLKQARWQGPRGEASYYSKSGARIRDLPAGSWIQYRAVLDTANGAASPILDKVEIEFD